MQIEKPITLDLLETKAPALSSTSDMPVIETKPDASPETKPEPKVEKPEVKVEVAAPDEGKKEVEAVSADDLEQPESPSASDKPKPAKGVQKRLDELTRQREDERRRADSEREEKLRLLAIIEARDKPKPAAAEEPQKPNKADFVDNPDGYTEALIKHAAEYAAWEVRADIKAENEANAKKREQESIAAESKKVQEAYVARVDKFKESHPDYSEVAESPDVQVSIPMAHAIAHSDDGPAVAYFLGSNPDEAARISKLSPPVQLMELGLIVAKLKASPAKPVSAAPAPIKPIKAGSDTPKLTPEEESMDQYAARRKKEMAATARPGARH